MSRPVPRPRRLRALIALAVCPALFVAAPAGAATRIISQADPRTIVAIPPAGGPAESLFHVSDGIVSNASASHSGRRIAFVQHLRSHAPGDDDVLILTERVWVMRGNGTRARVVRTFVRRKRGRNDWISPGPANGARSEIYSFDLSPDGRRIVITRGGFMASMRSNGRGFRVLPTPGYRAFDAEFAPGNGAIVLHFESFGDQNGIGITGATGGPLRNLRSSQFPQQESLSYDPTFSDDGRFIAFMGFARSGITSAIWLMRRSGQGQHTLDATVQRGETFSEPDFSPNGKSLVAVKSLSGNQTALFTVRRDGTHLRFLAPGPRSTRYPFTPDWTR